MSNPESPNKINEGFNQLSDDDLLVCVRELEEVLSTGILPDGMVRRMAKQIHDVTGIPPHNCLSIVQTKVPQTAAHRWARKMQFEIMAKPRVYELPDEANLESVKQINGHDLWAIRKNNNCLNKNGEWEYEPMPSSRTDDFMERCRYKSIEEAYSTWDSYSTLQRQLKSNYKP